MGSRRGIGGVLFAGRGGEFAPSVFLAGGGGGFEGPVEVGVGDPPNLGVADINEASAATRPGPL